MKKITILGSTGSIGKQTLEVCDITHGYEIDALTANKNSALMEKQVRKYRPRAVCMTDESAAKDLKVRISDTPTKVLAGTEGLCECAGSGASFAVVTAIVGIAGLIPTMAAVKAGKRIALANKETLVTAGSLVLKEAAMSGSEIIPVDSEHSAIFQAISNQRRFLKKIIITASGGPFFGKKREELKDVTVKEALNHPNWSMGAKITVDSATLVNKGLEIIEAMHLFNVDVSEIVPVIHRESIIHSMVEMKDGSIIAQMGIPDMKLPISYALSYPERSIPTQKELDLSRVGSLTFYDIDNEAFPSVELAKKAAREGGGMCTVFNGANEAAVELFLKGKCRFTDITEYIEKAMEKCTKASASSIEDIFALDAEARKIVKECD